MSTAELKYQLIELISGLNDGKVLKDIKNFISKKISSSKVRDADWWDELTEDQKAEIEASIAEANRGEFIPHEDVLKKYKKWLS